MHASRPVVRGPVFASFHRDLAAPISRMARLCRTLGLGVLLVAMPVQADDGSETAPEAKVNTASLFYVQVYRDKGRLLSGAAHDHVVRAEDFKAVLRFSPAEPRTCEFQLSAPVHSLAVDEPEMRKRVGYEGVLDPDDRKEVKEHMLADDQLDAKRHKTIDVIARNCRPAKAPDTYSVDLALTVRGKTKRLSKDVVIKVEAGSVSTRGSLRLRHADFGMEPYSAFLGAVKNAEELDFVWALRAKL